MNAEKLRKIRSAKPFRPADIILYLACAALTAAVLVASFRPGGDTVEIVYAGERHEYPLDEDRTLDLGCLTVVIRDGKVWVEDADCPDKVCEHTGRIGYGGQTIVCLPNEIVIRIVDSEITVSTGQR